MSRTAIQQTIYDQGADDARAGRPSTPPDGPLARHYEAGYASVPSKAPTASSKKKPAKKAPAKKKPAARKPARRRRPGPVRVVDKAARQVAAPIESNFVSGLAVFGTAVAIAFLFNLLRNAGTTATVLDRLVDAVKWLDSPTPIPYRN
jgi:hypothetical protein